MGLRLIERDAAQALLASHAGVSAVNKSEQSPTL
jgi:hypothetical protein